MFSIHSFCSLRRFAVPLWFYSILGYAGCGHTATPTLNAPSAELTNGSGQVSDQPISSTTLAPGNYDYKVTMIDANGVESLPDDVGYQVVDANRRAPQVVIHNWVNQVAVRYNLYRGPVGGYHFFAFTVVAQPNYVYNQFVPDPGTEPASTRLEPTEAMQSPVMATGYAVSVKSRVYQGDGCAVTFTPTSARSTLTQPARFAAAPTLTLTNGDGQTVSSTVSVLGGSVFVPMLQSGVKTVAISSAGAFSDPAPALVTVVPALRSAADTGHISVPANPFPTDVNHQTSLTPAGLELINTLQGRRALMFGPGETVGFIIPYEDLFRQQTVRATSYEIRDFAGNLVESGPITLAGSSATLVTGVRTPGNYRLGLYNGALAALGQVDSVGWWSFIVCGPSQSGLPLLGVGGRSSLTGGYAYTQWEQQPGAAPLVSDAPLSGFTSAQTSAVNFVRRTFVMVPGVSATAVLSVARPGRVLINGAVVQPLPLQWFADDHYTPVNYLFVAGTRYTIQVETLQQNGVAVADLQSSVPNLLTTAAIQSEAGTVGKVTVRDYPGNRIDDTGDHNDVAFRATLGAAGSLMRYALTPASQPGDVLPSLALESTLNLGRRDSARERRRVLFTLPSLTSSGNRGGTYSPNGLTTFLQGVLAGGIDPQNLAIEFDNEPDGDGGYATGAAYAPIFEAYAAAVRRASPQITIVGPGVVSIDTAGLAWIDSFLTQLGNDRAVGSLDGVSFHCYNNVEGNFGNGELAMNALAGVLAAHGMGGVPLWQTEQGYPDAYNGTATPRFGVRCLGMQLTLFDQYGLTCERNHYWYPAGEYVGNPSLFMTTTKGVCVYPNALLLRTWSDELAGKVYQGKFTPVAPWSGIIKGNFYQGGAGGCAVLLTDGETSLNVPVKVSGMTRGTLTVAGWDGHTSTVSVNGGVATLNLSELPSFVRLPAGVSLALNPPSAGPNLAAKATLSSPYPITNAALLNDGASTGTSRVPTYGPVASVEQTTATADVPLDLDFGASVSFNCVTVCCPLALQTDEALLDFALQRWDAATQQWVTFTAVTEEVRAYPQYGVNEPITLIDYSSKRNLFVLRFARQTTSKLRVLVFHASSGSCGTDAMQAYTTSSAAARPMLREIQVYQLANQVAGAFFPATFLTTASESESAP